MAADIQVIVDPAEIVASVTINSGAPGATGPQGIQGPQGLKGDQGIQGPQGVQGERGLQGIQGPAGVNGTNGSDASVTAANIESALGYVPADAENVGNPFNQELDTTDSPSFSKLNITGSGTSDSTFKVGSFEFQPFAVNNCWFGDNIFYGPTGFKLRNNGSAGAFYFQGSNSGGSGEEGQFRLTAGGLQGDTVSPSVQMKISHTGQFGVGSAISTATGNFSGASFYVDASGNLTAANFTPDDYLTDASQFAPASHTHPLSALTQSSATTGQVATWNGTAWVPTTPASGGGGSATTDASLLTSGTLDDARLSSNVSLDNINNSFTAGQAIAAPANTSALTASYSVTGANTTPLLDLSGTWNTTGVANGIRLNLTDTGSAASSVLFDFRVGNSRRCSIRKDGSFNFDTRDDASFTGIGLSNGGIGASVQISTGLAGRFLVSNGLVNMPSSQLFGWVSGTGLQNFPDVALARDAANTLAQRNSTNAQTFRLYGTFTDASNGRRLDITSTTAGIFTLTATGNGTGASGNLLKLTAPILLPASSVTLATNGDLAFEATSNTTLTIRYRGSDGTTRSAAITLA